MCARANQWVGLQCSAVQYSAVTSAHTTYSTIHKVHTAGLGTLVMGFLRVY